MSGLVDMLKELDSVKIIDNTNNWQDAVEECFKPLLKKEYINIESAGEYRVYECNSYDIETKIESLSVNWKKNDIISINIYGIIEDENELEKTKKSIINKYSKNVRYINLKNSQLYFLENAYNERIIKEFLDIVNSYEFDINNKDNLEILELAKRLGIEKIYNALQ